MAQLVKNPPAVRETWVPSLGCKDPLEKGKATHSSILAWRIPWTTVHGVAKSRTRLGNFHISGIIQYLSLDCPLIIKLGCLTALLSLVAAVSSPASVSVSGTCSLLGGRVSSWLLRELVWMVLGVENARASGALLMSWCGRRVVLGMLTPSPQGLLSFYYPE